MSQLFPNRAIETNPKVLIRKDDISSNDFGFVKKTLVGTFFRVTPSNAKEVIFLQGLPKNYIVFTPEHGNGLIISPSCLKNQSS